MSTFDAVFFAVLHSGVTAFAYALGLAVYRRSGHKSWLHPVITAAAVLALLIQTGLLDLEQYRDGTRALVWLLGPATVALALPLSQQLAAVRQQALPLALALGVGAFTATASALFLAQWFGLEPDLWASLAPKTITSPLAMEVAAAVGGDPGLAAALVIVTGVIGAVCAPPLLQALGTAEPRVLGFTLGLSAHGVGTARALEEGSECGAFASLAMGATGVLVGVALPLILNYWL
ncbi:MAG: LrgB family protein [Pseudomonadota bacterium]|nr:LrgB family protein [Pseudomonadota bacterium]